MVKVYYAWLSCENRAGGRLTDFAARSSMHDVPFQTVGDGFWFDSPSHFCPYAFKGVVLFNHAEPEGRIFSRRSGVQICTDHQSDHHVFSMFGIFCSFAKLHGPSSLSLTPTCSAKEKLVAKQSLDSARKRMTQSSKSPM